MSNPQILSITSDATGSSSVVPSICRIDTNDSIATVTTAGYLNHASAEHIAAFNNRTIALVTTVNAGVASANWYQVSVTGTPGAYVYSLVAV